VESAEGHREDRPPEVLGPGEVVPEERRRQRPRDQGRDGTTAEEPEGSRAPDPPDRDGAADDGGAAGDDDGVGGRLGVEVELRREGDAEKRASPQDPGVLVAGELEDGEEDERRQRSEGEVLVDRAMGDDKRREPVEGPPRNEARSRRQNRRSTMNIASADTTNPRYSVRLIVANGPKRCVTGVMTTPSSGIDWFTARLTPVG